MNKFKTVIAIAAFLITGAATAETVNGFAAVPNVYLASTIIANLDAVANLADGERDVLRMRLDKVRNKMAADAGDYAKYSHAQNRILVEMVNEINSLLLDYNYATAYGRLCSVQASSCGNVADSQATVAAMEAYLVAEYGQ